MSSTQARLPRTEAVALSWELVGLLAPYCDRPEVLGSIRRQRPDCGDIELLTIPKTVDHPITNMFGEVVRHRISSQLETQLDNLLFERVLSQRQPIRWGPRYRAAIYRDFPVDLYICRPDQWGYLSIIRTGSNEFCKRFVTPIEKGGWMPAGMYCEGGSLWAAGPPGGARIGTPEEADVFAAIGRPYVSPELREV